MRLSDHAWLLLPLTTIGGLAIIIGNQFSSVNEYDLPTWVESNRGCRSFIYEEYGPSVWKANFEGITDYCLLYGSFE